jgi:myo-inositol-1(or 4)-monophosphatase
MQDVNLEYYLAFARHLVIRAGQVALKQFRHTHAWLKANRSPVTDADIQIETMIRVEIHRRFPDHLFLGEESVSETGALSRADWIWVADPIDGTGAYFSGLPVWGVSLALIHDGQPVMGVFYQPVTGEMYSATATGDAMFTLQPNTVDEETRAIHVEMDPGLSNLSLFLVPSNFHREFTSDYPGKQRTLGSVAAHLGVVARGAAVASIQAPSVWDVAATALILKRAGGELLCFESGKPVDFADYLHGDYRMPWTLAVSNGVMFEKVRSVLTRRNRDNDEPTC